jgi:hypothetical protein
MRAARMSKNEFVSELGARERKKKEKKHGDERCLLLLRVDVMKLILEDDIIQIGESLWTPWTPCQLRWKVPHVEERRTMCKASWKDKNDHLVLGKGFQTGKPKAL